MEKINGEGKIRLYSYSSADNIITAVTDKFNGNTEFVIKITEDNKNNAVIRIFKRDKFENLITVVDCYIDKDEESFYIKVHVLYSKNTMLMVKVFKSFVMTDIIIGIICSVLFGRIAIPIAISLIIFYTFILKFKLNKSNNLINQIIGELSKL